MFNQEFVLTSVKIWILAFKYAYTYNKWNGLIHCLYIYLVSVAFWKWGVNLRLGSKWINKIYGWTRTKCCCYLMCPFMWIIRTWYHWFWSYVFNIIYFLCYIYLSFGSSLMPAGVYVSIFLWVYLKYPNLHPLGRGVVKWFLYHGIVATIRSVFIETESIKEIMISNNNFLYDFLSLREFEFLRRNDFLLFVWDLLFTWKVFHFPRRIWKFYWIVPVGTFYFKFNRKPKWCIVCVLTVVLLCLFNLKLKFYFVMLLIIGIKFRTYQDKGQAEWVYDIYPYFFV